MAEAPNSVSPIRPKKAVSVTLRIVNAILPIITGDAILKMSL